jgi:hypothetical protein
MRVGLFDFEDAGFTDSLLERGARVEAGPATELDLAFLMVREPADLHRLADLRPLIRSNGAVWVLQVKGPRATVREVDVIDAGRHHRLVDNKIASFSDTLAAMRLVIPVGQRARTPSGASRHLPQQVGEARLAPTVRHPLTMSAVEVLGPKGPARHGGVDLLRWASEQLRLASEIVDNPGGGLLFATQTIGQVKAGLAEADGERWKDVVRILDQAEDSALRRQYGRARELVSRAVDELRA